MKRMKANWASLSRPVRILLLLLMLATAGFMAYIALGSPPLTAEMGFRQAERASMIGPAQILTEFQLDHPNENGSKVIIAQSDEFDIVYHHSSLSLNAYPKKAHPSIYYLAGYPKFSEYERHDSSSLQLILFDRTPEAVTAKIIFSETIPAVHSNHKVIFQETAVRKHNGFFTFSITPISHAQEVVLNYMLSYCGSYTDQGKTEVQVMLYDKDGQLFSRQTILPGPSIDLNGGVRP